MLKSYATCSIEIVVVNAKTVKVYVDDAYHATFVLSNRYWIDRTGVLSIKADSIEHVCRLIAGSFRMSNRVKNIEGILK